MSPASPERAFELIAGHPALDLVNIFDWRFRDTGPEELLSSYDDLLRFSAQSEILSPKQIRQIVRTATQAGSAAALVACRELREALAEIFYSAVGSRTPPASQLNTFERHYRHARAGQRLVWSPSHSGARLSWEWPPSELSPDLPVWILTVGAARLLLSTDMHRLRACEKPDCRWLFLDTSKNHSRRWCDMKICGNRIKARRFKAQHKS